MELQLRLYATTRQLCPSAHSKSPQHGLNITLDNSIIAANSTAPNELSLLPFYSPFGFALKCLPLNWRWLKCLFDRYFWCIDTAWKKKKRTGVRQQPEIIKSKQLKAKTCSGRSGVRPAGSWDGLCNWNRDRAQTHGSGGEREKKKSEGGQKKWWGRSWERDCAITMWDYLNWRESKSRLENRRCVSVNLRWKHRRYMYVVEPLQEQVHKHRQAAEKKKKNTNASLITDGSLLLGASMGCHFKKKNDGRASSVLVLLNF